MIETPGQVMNAGILKQGRALVGISLLCTWFALAGLLQTANGNATLIPDGATWKYLDTGSNQGSAWRAPTFNDQTWKSGPAELGYGDGGEATVVSYGSNSSNKYITTYFRHSFSVADPAAFESLALRLRRDDGAIVYLNGTEVFRTNLPTGAIASTTRAVIAVDGADENVVASIVATHLLPGSNVVAVELHQASPTSSDISFQLSLEGIIKTPSVILIPSGSSWRYLDDGTDQGSQWREPAYDDQAWSVGLAELGYGDGAERTITNSTTKAATYFRREFDVADPALYSALTLRLMRDDGAIVYLNGVEIHRSNMPAGPVTSTTWASSAVAEADESTFLQVPINSPLAIGRNVLAVEVHQSDALSSDVSFDLELLGLTDRPEINITRGPYLQNATSSSMVIRWRTDLPTTSKVWIGTSPAGLAPKQENPSSATEHEVQVTGLLPNTQYYYAIGSSTGQLASGSEYTFFTPPVPGTKQPIRAWVLGDSGTANANAVAVRNGYSAFNGSRYTDLWLMLGDNAYQNGTDAEFQAAVFNMYPAFLRQSPLWSTLGNHEYYTAQGTPYFDIHTFPTAGEAGGAPSGTEKYYSFDYGNAHFVCLDSMSSDRSTAGPMAAWLRADLESTTQDWIIAFWHHPPYTAGSHNSDNPNGSDRELLEMRENFLPLLEAGGVDLVLGGHSHSYERSYLIDGHYGLSQTFSDTMKKAAGDGREVNGAGSYIKPDGLPANQGAVYIVAGSSGKATTWWGGSTAVQSPAPHPAMVVSLLKLGSTVLDIDDDRLDVKFLNTAGTVDDQFTIRKNAPNGPPTVAITSPAAGSSVNAPVTISASATPGPAEEAGSVVQVDFYDGDALIGTASAPSPANAQFEITWNAAVGGVRSFTATAWDDKGASTTSAPVSVTVNAAPSVSITTPVSNARYEVPASIAIAATAADSGGSVAQVSFYASGQLIGSDTAAPYEVSWENVPIGTYLLTAVASDEMGATATSAGVSITVSAPNMAPEVSLTSPSAGASFVEPANVTLVANATDVDGVVTRVEFYAGSLLLSTDTSAPFSHVWTSAMAGTHALSAVAIDDAGKSATSAVVSITVNPNQPPTVGFVSPVEGAVFVAPTAVPLFVDARDVDGPVVRVEFYAKNGDAASVLLGLGSKSSEGDSWSYSWDPAPIGRHILTAVAVDGGGAKNTSLPVQITVEPPPNQAPTVSISSPANGASYVAPATIQLTATAGDIDGTVAKVEFYSGAALIGSDNVSPFTMSWAGIVPGTYALTAVATDNGGKTATSAAVNITVVPEPVPQAPVNLAAKVVKSRIDLSWGDRSTNETGFYIERSLNGTSWTRHAAVGANVVVYRDTTITANTLYYYRVQAFNVSGASGYTLSVSARSQR